MCTAAAASRQPGLVEDRRNEKRLPGWPAGSNHGPGGPQTGAQPIELHSLGVSGLFWSKKNFGEKKKSAPTGFEPRTRRTTDRRTAN
jgi:hypothetical protein